MNLDIIITLLIRQFTKLILLSCIVDVGLVLCLISNKTQNLCITIVSLTSRSSPSQLGGLSGKCQ